MPVDQFDAIDALLTRSGRDHLPLRRAFVQRRGVRGGGAGPLASFVSSRRSVALDLYLLVHTLASDAPFTVSLATSVWARLTGLEGPAGAARITRSWKWLEEENLIAVSGKSRSRVIEILREDGSGRPYIHPGASSEGEIPEGDYFKLPYVYWRGRFFGRMGLPGKAVLLIALSLEDDFLLPIKQGSKWYGVSEDTIKRGLRQLFANRLLDVRTIAKPAPLSPAGVTQERRYTLRTPFRPDQPSG